MKSLFSVLLYAFSLTSIAGSLTVLDQPAGRDRYKKASFVVNQTDGTAWVRVKFTRRTGDGIDYRSKDAKVSGLRYDKASNSVLLDHEGQLVECGTLEARRVVVRYFEVQENGNCSFTGGNIKVNLGNGNYALRTQVRLTVK